MFSKTLNLVRVHSVKTFRWVCYFILVLLLAFRYYSSTDNQKSLTESAMKVNPVSR
jgi:hypothetical protein